MRKVYMDHSATTPAHPDVAKIMNEFMVDSFGNASSVHSFGREARNALDKARQQVADLIGAEAKEIVFTSGGTEADNHAIKGVAKTYSDKGKHIITTKFEHHAVLHTCEYLEKEHDFKVTYLPVSKDGYVQVSDLEEAIRNDTILITVMYANNEIGTIQPIKEMAKLAKKEGIIFHTDAVQGVGVVPIDVKDLEVDLLTLSGHKFYGPKGVGALFVKKGMKIDPMFHGGSHEMKIRAGTENVPGIAGIGKAAEIALHQMKERSDKIVKLRDKLAEGIIAKIDHVQINGGMDNRLPGNLNVSIAYVEGEALLLNLDQKGIAVSSGSACTSGSLDPSHVLLAIDLPHELAHGSLRLTLGAGNSEQDVDYVLNELPEIVVRLRSMSPLYEETKKSEKEGCAHV